MIGCRYSRLHALTPITKYKEWLAEMEKTHRLRACPGCGLYVVWVPKPSKVAIHG